MRQAILTCALCAARATRTAYARRTPGRLHASTSASPSSSALLGRTGRPRLPRADPGRTSYRPYSQEEVLAATRAKLGIEADSTDVPDSSRRQSEALSAAWQTYDTLETARTETTRQLAKLSDAEMAELFEAELESLNTQIAEHIENRMADLLLAPDPTAELPALLSLNAGVGGDEASLCAGMLKRAYERYTEVKGWKIETMSYTEGGQTMGGKGVKEITMKITAGNSDERDVYGKLRWEGGIHRFQRVPPNDAKGRIHTSTVAVIALPVIPEDANAGLVDPKDVRIEVMRSRGAGGQHVNKTESAVRLTHNPTGITVSMQDSRSQHQNRAWAWEILRSRLFERREAEQAAERKSKRQEVAKGASRSDKIRSYNIAASRVTDHRVGFQSPNISGILDGELEPIMYALREDEEDRILQDLIASADDVDDIDK